MKKPKVGVDVLNLIWFSFFVAAFAFALGRLVWGETDIFTKVMAAAFESAKTAFEIALFLTGILALWLGIMHIGEKAGFVRILTRFLTPFFRKVMPEVPKDHPALGSITMNMAANMLGLDNAATPMGLKAMEDLQTLNPEKESASNAQILFMVINASSVTILPVTIFAYRAQLGAANPTGVFIPILLATFCSTLAGFLSVAFFQRIRIWDRVVLSYLGGFAAVVGLMLWYFGSLPQEEMQTQSGLVSNLLLFSIVVGFMILAMVRRVNVYETFIEGAREGFTIAIRIVPYLVAMLVAVGVFRASGALDLLLGWIRSGVMFAGFDTAFVDALPTMFMKPLSGSGARAMMLETMQHFGADSFAGRLACIIQGSTETTFYVLAVYCGAVGIKRMRHAVACSLLADLGGFIAAITVGYVFFAGR